MIYTSNTKLLNIAQYRKTLVRTQITSIIHIITDHRRGCPGGAWPPSHGGVLGHDEFDAACAVCLSAQRPPAATALGWSQLEVQRQSTQRQAVHAHNRCAWGHFIHHNAVTCFKLKPGMPDCSYVTQFDLPVAAVDASRLTDVEGPLAERRGESKSRSRSVAKKGGRK
jgi:hypothetical protein